MIKKIFYSCSIATLLVGNIHGYELATSIYYPLWDDSDPVMKETKPERYEQNYFDPLLINTMTKIFIQKLDANNKSKHDELNQRLHDAILGFHAKAIEAGTTGFFAKKLGFATNFPLRTSNMIDFIGIPLVDSQNLKLSLNDYTTKLRKEAIANSKGSEWAGGRQFILGKRSLGRDPNNYVYDTYPAKIEGVKYNSFVSELVTILNEAHKYNLQLAVLEQIEKVSKMSHDDIKEAVEAFNKKNIGNSGLDHPVDLGYGYINSQKSVLTEATEVQKNHGRGGKELLGSVLNNEKNSAMPKKLNIGVNTDLRVLAQLGGKLSEVEAPERLVRNEMPMFRFTNFKMHLPALKQLYPEVWGNYE